MSDHRVCKLRLSWSLPITPRLHVGATDRWCHGSRRGMWTTPYWKFLNRTWQMRPPEKYDHLLPVPSVVVIPRFDCTSVWTEVAAMTILWCGLRVDLRETCHKVQRRCTRSPVTTNQWQQTLQGCYDHRCHQTSLSSWWRGKKAKERKNNQERIIMHVRKWKTSRSCDCLYTIVPDVLVEIFAGT